MSMVFHPEAGLEIAGRYRLVQRIGGDVLGVLWEGVRVVDDRPVLLELVRSEGVGQTAVSHVWRAAMLIERIEHAGAVGIEDVVGAGPTADMLPVAVVPTVRGVDFDHWLRERSRTLAEALAMLREVVDVLESAHAAVDARGRREPVTHLGLKPSEVIVGDDAYRGPRRRAMHVRVRDFCLARDRVEEDGTGTVTSVSSPRFESPEMFAYPDFEGPWSDVWSVGVMLYVVASGTYPFGDPTDTPFLLQRHILDRKITPLDARDPRIPRALAELVERCLAKNPSGRFEDAAELARAMDGLPPIDAALPAHPFPTTKPPTRASLADPLELGEALAPARARPRRSAGPLVLAAATFAAVFAVLAVGGTTFVRRAHDTNASALRRTSARLRTEPPASVAVAASVAQAVAPAAEATERDPAALELRDNPLRLIRAPDEAHALGCEREPALTTILVDESVAVVPLRRAVVERGLLAGLSTSRVCAPNDHRDSAGRCWVMGCPPRTSGPDETGRCLATRPSRAPIQRCFRREAARTSVSSGTRVMLQEHEVTWAELARFVKRRGGPVFLGADPASGARRPSTWGGEIPSERSLIAAHGVPRGLAAAYCEALGARLPTEAELETAARGPRFVAAPWGHASIELGTQLFALGPYGSLPRAVRDDASLDRTVADEPIYDLVGNVREWASDAYAPDAPPVDSANVATAAGTPAELGVVRGLPLTIPHGWPALTRARTVQSLMPVPAAYREAICVDSEGPLDTPGRCAADAGRYLTVLHEVGFRCARSEP